MNIRGILLAVGPRLIGSAVTAVAGWVYAKTQGTVMVDPEMASKMIVGGLLTYAATHRAASALINPGDAATGRVADSEKRAAETGGSPFVERPNK